MSKSIEIKILDTDKIFYDSPNAGEASCICSRCHKPIKDGEVPLRVAIDSEIIYAKDSAGKQRPNKIESADGMEFRLCEKCTDSVFK